MSEWCSTTLAATMSRLLVFFPSEVVTSSSVGVAACSCFLGLGGFTFVDFIVADKLGRVRGGEGGNNMLLATKLFLSLEILQLTAAFVAVLVVVVCCCSRGDAAPVAARMMMGGYIVITWWSLFACIRHGCIIASVVLLYEPAGGSRASANFVLVVSVVGCRGGGIGDALNSLLGIVFVE